MTLERFIDHVGHHAWQLLASAVVGLVGLGSWVGTIEWRLPSKSDITQAAALQADITTIKQAVAEMQPQVRQTAIDMATLKGDVAGLHTELAIRVQAADKTHEQLEQDVRDLQRRPRAP